MSTGLVKESSANATHIAYNATTTHPVIGPSMFYGDDYYYLLFSSVICCGYDTSLPVAGEEYKIMMYRSKSATSGFVDKNGISCLESGGSILESGGSILMELSGTKYSPGGQ